MNHEIDIHNEKVIPINEVPKLLPKRKGKKTHYQTVYRWTTKGNRGKRLASVKIGGIRYTSVEALGRFFESKHSPYQAGTYQDSIDRALSRYGM